MSLLQDADEAEADQLDNEAFDRYLQCDLSSLSAPELVADGPLEPNAALGAIVQRVGDH